MVADCYSFQANPVSAGYYYKWHKVDIYILATNWLISDLQSIFSGLKQKEYKKTHGRSLVCFSIF